MTPYEKYLCASAEYEVHQLKESGHKFVVNKAAFDPGISNTCLYGQNFEHYDSKKAIKFKKKPRVNLVNL